MKKLVLVLGLVGLVSCNKNNPKPNQNCNCGVIVDDQIYSDPNTFESYYTLSIKNDCSGNIGMYYFTFDVWLESHVGENFCITNVPSWLPNKPLVKIQKKGKEIIK